jgi:histone H3/H4
MKKEKQVKPIKSEDRKVNLKPVLTINKRRVKRQSNNYSIYIYKILRKEHKDLNISSKSMEILNSIAKDIINTLSQKASMISKRNKIITLSHEHIKSAAKLLLPGELATNSIKRAEIAKEYYIESVNSKSDDN